MYKNGSIHLTILLLGILVLCVQVPAQATSYTGSLTSADGGLLGTGIWFDNTAPGWFAPELTWIVTWNDDNSWHYDYTLSVFSKSVSHMIVEASPSFGSENIWGESGPFASVDVGDFGAGGPNPGMPDGVHGIKFDSTTGTSVRIQFDSDRAPVWGDLYAKDGKSDGIDNALWNAGFTIADYDPQSPVQSGSFMGHLLVPDTVPEPCGLAAFIVGLTSLASMGLRRRRD
jgi:hypothetical protein